MSLRTLPAPFLADAGLTRDAFLERSGFNVDGSDFTGFAAAPIDAHAYGAKGDGSTDDSGPLAQAEAVAYRTGGTLVLRPGKTYYTGGTTLTVRSDLMAQGATISYAGTGIALLIGQTSAITLSKRLVLPTVVQAAKTVIGWAQAGGADTGVRLLNLYSCIVFIPRIVGFATGLEVRGEGRGNVYNTVFVGHLDNNKVNHRLSADATGWSNENTYFIQRFSKNSGEGTTVSGTRGILVEAATNVCNNNRWIGPALEGDVDEFEIECFGQVNLWLHGRYECTGGAAVQFNSANAVSNTIDGGYKSDAIVFTQVNGAFKNNLRNPAKTRQQASVGGNGMDVRGSTGSSTDPIFILLTPGTDALTATPSTDYNMSWSADLIRGKRTADAFPRIQVASQNAAFLVGTGTVAPTAGMTPIATDHCRITGLTLPTKLLTFADSPYTVLATDTSLGVDTTGGNVTLNLPSSSNVTGKVLLVKKTTTDANTVTLDGSGAQTIDGALTLVIAGGSRGSASLYATGVVSGTDSWWNI